MRYLESIFVLLCLSVGLLAPAPVTATAGPQEPEDATGEEEASPEAEGEEGEGEEEEVDPYVRFVTPGPHHERLGELVGEWDSELQIWLAPEEEPLVTEGEVVTRWILGDRFIETVYRGELMGQPFEGKGVEGYDNHLGEFVGTWRDTTGTNTLVFRGQVDSTQKVRTMSADFVDPLSGVRLVNRTVTTLIDEDSYQFESFLVGPDGTSFKNMEMQLSRRD